MWTLTQDPGVHQRWDLRFSRIEFLPKEDETDPRRFIYETRIVQVSPYAAPVRASPRAWQRMVGKPIFIKARLA